MTATTIKVSPTTRDRIKALSIAEQRTADQVLMAALDALEQLRRRRQMREESRLGLDDIEDQVAIQELRADVDASRAW